MVDIKSYEQKLLIRNSEILLSPIAFSKDGTVFASTWDYGTLVLRETASGKIRKAITTPLEWASIVLFSPDEKSIVEGDDNGDVIIWDIAPVEE